MKYYKVKKECDNTNIYIKKNNRLYHDGFLIGNELKTVNEYNKLMSRAANKNYLSSCFYTVEINKNNVFWFFGARFAN